MVTTLFDFFPQKEKIEKATKKYQNNVMADNADSNTPATTTTSNDNQSEKKTLHVSRLSKKITDDILRETFEKVGKITSCTVMKDPHSGESLQYAFIAYETHEDAEKAIKELRSYS